MVVGLFVAAVVFFGSLAVLGPADRRACFESTAVVCGEGIEATVEYAGIPGFSSCNIACGMRAGELITVDHSWPFGRDR